MQEPYFEVQWPRDNLFFAAYVHEILSYRYHWHESEYEINIILHGRAEFCCGGELHILEENDVILIAPGIGHASFSLQADTLALVLRFSARAFKPYLEQGQIYSFSNCISGYETQNAPEYCRIRFYIAQALQALHEKTIYSTLTAKSSLELLLSTLCNMFAPQPVSLAPQLENLHQETMRKIISYIENNFTSKITLEDLANFTQYNRTYISTIFKDCLCMNFHEYLTRVRFQHALSELTNTQKNLTEIAIDNGFADLKSFNSRFRAILQRTPAEYREQIAPERAALFYNQRSYRSISHPLIQRKLFEYMRLPDIACTV